MHQIEAPQQTMEAAIHDHAFPEVWSIYRAWTLRRNGKILCYTMLWHHRL
jgi:hypothetical protein